MHSVIGTNWLLLHRTHFSLVYFLNRSSKILANVQPFDIKKYSILFFDHKNLTLNLIFILNREFADLSYPVDRGVVIVEKSSPYQDRNFSFYNQDHTVQLSYDL